MSRQGKSRPRTIKNIKIFWNKEAIDWGHNPRVTIRDHYFRLLEIETITKLIKKKKEVLDIGCGTGFSSLFYAEVVDNLIGEDYAEPMIDRANLFLKNKKYFDRVVKKYTREKKPKLHDNIKFKIGNILELQYPNQTFDCVIAERVLINLPTKKLQNNAVKEVRRVIKPKGKWISAEVSIQGHKKIDTLRKKFNLPKLEKYWHNLYIDERDFIKKVCQEGFELSKKIHFETYQFLTKIIHPLVAKPRELKFISGFNKAAMIVSKNYPLYNDVIKVGYEKFFTNIFKKQLLLEAPAKVKKYDEIIQQVLNSYPNFKGASHQVLFVFEKSDIH